MEGFPKSHCQQLDRGNLLLVLIIGWSHVVFWPWETHRFLHSGFYRDVAIENITLHYSLPIPAAHWNHTGRRLGTTNISPPVMRIYPNTILTWSWNTVTIKNDGSPLLYLAIPLCTYKAPSHTHFYLMDMVYPCTPLFRSTIAHFLLLTACLVLTM